MAATQDSSSRPVLRRTQPKVLPKSVPTQPSKPMKKTERIPSLNPAPQVKIPPQDEEQKLPTIDFSSPASVLQSLPCISVDEDDTCSIASSSSMSPSFKKDSPCSVVRSKIKATSTPKSRSIARISDILPPSPQRIARTSDVLPPSPQQVLARRKLKISHYGRKQGSPQAVAPQSPQAADQKKTRCGWLSLQSDPAYVAYHDEEWGVPVHDDKMLFELLVLASAQSEMGWSLILSKRDTYRRAFEGFDPVAVAAFDKKKVAALKSELDIFQQSGKLQAIVENAGRVLQIIQEFGSLSNYMWGFVNKKPIVTNYRSSAQVPVKSSKSEMISKDLVKRGFSTVGPTTIYSFMQACGMTNDHISSCFRHKECCEIKQVIKDNEGDKLDDISNKEKCEGFQHGYNISVPVC